LELPIKVNHAGMDIQDYQKKLFPYAYNILGSQDDARDAVQDVITKYVSANKPDIDSPVNYLIKSVINQSINIKKRSGKSSPAKVSLPEPVSTDSADNNINRKEIISYSLLVDSVNAKERAVFILKEAFDYSHEEIADKLQISIEGSRKLLSRAKMKLGALKKDDINRSAVNASSLENYVNAIKNGDVKNLETLLVKDIAIMVDGGNVRIVSAFESGIENVIQLITYVYNTYQAKAEIKISMVNHQPALLFYKNGRLTNCQIFELDENSLITGIYSIVDPEKLKNFNKI
jgi:RNA polymerase sigma-70 factor (ECF subfamily)